MSQTLEGKPTRMPVRRRSPILDYTLVIIGAFVALAGVYFQFAPSDWWPADVSDLYRDAAYTLGGLLLAAGFYVTAGRAYEQDGYQSGRVIAAGLLAVAATIGTAVAALFWIL